MAPPFPRLRRRAILPALAFLAIAWFPESAICAGGVYDDTTGMEIGPAPAAPPIELDRRIHAIRVRYRQESFPQVESIRFTVTEARGRSEAIRHWTWFTAPDSVFFSGEDAKGIHLQAGYSRKNQWSLSSATIALIDSSFQRDRFALLFPQILAIEPGMEARMDSAFGKKGAQGRNPGTREDWIRISYPAGAGILAGETYRLLADADGTIRAWTVPESGSRIEGRRFDWSPPEKVDGLPLSLERKGPEGRSIRFSGIKVVGITH